MGRTNHSQRQKNKPFKGKSNGKKEKGKVKASTKTKNIAKSKGRVKNNRSQLLQKAKNKKNRELTSIADKNEYLDSSTKELVMQKIKNGGENKVIVLFGGNEEANTDELLDSILNEIKVTKRLQLSFQFNALPFKVLEIIPESKAFIKSKMMIISAGPLNSNHLEPLSDLLKCADIICPVLSCKNTNTSEMRENPYEQGGAFDDTGYKILNMIRSMGTPAVIGIVRDIGLKDWGYHDKIERLFKRFITSQLGQNSRINYLKGNNHDQVNKLLRQMDTTPAPKQPWKKDRAYILVDKFHFQEEPQTITLSGYLKGSCIHANQLCHVTGIDDFQISKIQISKPPKGKTTILPQYATNSESLFAFSKLEESGEHLLSALNGLKLELDNNENHGDKMQIEEEEIEECEDSGDNFEDESEEEEENATRKKIEMKRRNEDELQFEDEVEYAAEEILRQKFREYQGLKDFKNSEWNHLENLPDEYDRIYTFKHYNRTKQNALGENQAKGYAYPGFYVSVTLKNFPITKLLTGTHPTILTFLLKHERKMTQLHLKVKKNPYYPLNDITIESNQNYFISMGFRRMVVKPIFSQIIQGTEKTKYISKIKQNNQNNFYCSFYYYNYFPPAPVQIHRVNQFNFNEVQSSPVLYGEIAKCDPLHIILERKILTGYPFKIYKRRCVVRYMFFNAEDVKYFKPIEVRTKSKLKGRIEESRGTHGFMKVLFSDKIKHDDTVCMYLYRRVYPEFPF